VNIHGEKGKGGQENQGAKGHLDNSLPSGSSITLLETEVSGIVNRIWLIKELSRSLNPKIVSFKNRRLPAFLLILLKLILNKEI